MPRPTKPSLYQLVPDGVWHYRFTACGQRHRGSTGERDRGAAQAALAARYHEAHRAAGRPVSRGPAAQLGLADLAGLWLATLEEDATTRNPRYVRRHEQAIAYAVERFDLASDVTDDAWQAAMRELRARPMGNDARGRKVGPPSWRTLEVATYSLRMLLEFAVSVGAIAAVPAVTAPTKSAVAKGEAPRRALSEEERDRVLRAMAQNGDRRAHRIWQTMAYTGLRRGELAKLTLRWVDQRAKVLRVPANAAKSGAAEVVPLHPKALRAIIAEASAREGGAKDMDSPVFGSSDIRRAWRRALARSKVDVHGLTPYHSARHTYGTLVAQAARGDVSAIMAAGRWRSLEIAQRYVHASAERARAAVKRLS